MNDSAYSKARHPRRRDALDGASAPENARTTLKGGSHGARTGRSSGRLRSSSENRHGFEAESSGLARKIADRQGKGHGRRLWGLGEAPELEEKIRLYAPERLSPDALPEPGSFCVHIAARGLLGPLLEELGERIIAVRGRAVLATATGSAQPFWAQTTWLNPQWIPISSIGDAARKLAGQQRNWLAHLDNASGLNRRTTLIQEALPHVSARLLTFGDAAPTAPLGAFLLWTPDLMLASASTSSPFADGEVHFAENRDEPPGRAYLKLWEAFTIFGCRPAPGELCIELGAAPGSWTWVLAQCGARVFSLDKAPLAEHIAKLQNVEHCLGSGFALTPDCVGRIDWLFSDMICYPQRLLALIRQWIDAKTMRRALCTIKFQSQQDHSLIAEFAAIPGSQIRHLSCNKHELTWFYQECRP